MPWLPRNFEVEMVGEDSTLRPGININVMLLSAARNVTDLNLSE